MGHYLAVPLLPRRRHAALLHSVPLLFSLVGTLGAFIRIRSPIPNRRALFDIGIAGPLAGFVVCLPVLVLGIARGAVRRAASGGGRHLSRRRRCSSSGSVALFDGASPTA